MRAKLRVEAPPGRAISAEACRYYIGDEEITNALARMVIYFEPGEVITAQLTLLLDKEDIGAMTASVQKLLLG